MRVLTVLLCSLTVLTGCPQQPSGDLRIVDAFGYAPITDNAPAVAYFALQNDSDTDVRIRTVSSRLFARAEIHETLVENGQSRMRPVADLIIEAGKTQWLQPGGMHLMLMRANSSVAAGDLDTLTIEYNTDRTVVADVVLRDRLSATAIVGDQH